MTDDLDNDWFPTLEQILAAAEADESGENPLAHYVEVTPEKVALAHIVDAEEQLRRCEAEPIRLAQAAKSAHLALQASLTAALAGSMGIGAYVEKDRLKWLRHLEGNGEQPTRDRVMSFDGLLQKATSEQLEWHAGPLSVSPEERELLARLGGLRDRIEHTRPISWLIEPIYIRQAIGVAAKITAQLLQGMWHRLEQGDVDQLNAACGSIAEATAPD